MEVTNTDKRYNDFLELLNGKDEATLVESIKNLREEEPFKGAVGLLVTQYDNSNSPLVKKAIEDLFNDMKDSSVQEEIIFELKKRWRSETSSMLISSCWQSRLDYTKYLKEFAEIFASSDYVTAIECMTVISEFCGKADASTKEELVRIINNSSNAFSHEMKPLSEELIGYIKEH